MFIEKANISFKLECFLMQLDFIEIKERVVVKSRLYFARPVGFFYTSKLWDDLFKRLEDWKYHRTGLYLRKPIAKSAIDLTSSLS